jgi:Zn-dependent protease
MDGTLLQALALIPALIIAIVCHEVAHGWVALALGDPTAKERGRLTLNPVRHVDPVGTLVVPGMLALAGLPVFGWAKPVPVIKRRLNNPRFGMMAVAAAGPGTNLVLATLGAIALGALALASAPAGTDAGQVIDLWRGGRLLDPSTALGFASMIGLYFVLINVFLALFNLLPIPPFDGSHIVEGLLPPRAARTYEKLRPFGFPLLFILLLVIPWLFPHLGVVERIVLPPVLWAQDLLFDVAAFVAGA